MKYLDDMTCSEKREFIQDVHSENSLLNTLLALQRCSRYNCLDAETVSAAAEVLSVPEGRIRELISFYTMLNGTNSGRYVLEICSSTPCRIVKGASVERTLKKRLGISVGDTTEDGVIELRYTSCIGACDIGPVIKIGDDVHGDLTEEKINDLIDALYKKVESEGRSDVC